MASELCMNCFSVKGQYEVCPFCGYVEGTPPAQPHCLTPGTILANHFIVGTVIGFGGFGITYKCFDTTLGVIVAVKEFYPAGLVNRAPGETMVGLLSGAKKEQYQIQLKRFLMEAQSIAQFGKAKDIVNVYDFFEANNTAYIIMEYIDGVLLKDYLDKQGRMEPDIALSVISPIVEAVKKIHAKGIVHRDISPDNIFISGEDSIKLFDFGAAQLNDKSEGEKVIKVGYSAPEQYRDKSRQGFFTDIYSIGAILYQMVTGVKPMESTEREYNDTLKSPRELGIDIEPNLDRAIMEAMAVRPELRFQGIQQLDDALHSKRIAEYPKEKLKRRKRRRNWTISLSATLVMAVVVVIGLFSTVLKPENPIFDTKLSKDTITVWVDNKVEEEKLNNIVKNNFKLDSSKVSDEETKEMYENNQKIDVVVTYVDNMEKTLGEAKEAGTLPDMFLSDSVSNLEQYNLASMKDNVYAAVDTSDYLYLSEYSKYFKDMKEMPTGLDTLLLYSYGITPSLSNTLSDSQYYSQQDASVEIDDIIKRNKQSPQTEYTHFSQDSIIYTALLNDGSFFDVYTGELTADDTLVSFVNGIYQLQETTQNKTEDKKGSSQNSVLKGNSVVAGIGYRTTANSTQDGKVNKPLDYSVSVVTKDKRMLIEFANCYAINADSSQNKQTACMRLLWTILSEAAQKNNCANNKDLPFPIHKTAFESFFDSNARYESFQKLVDMANPCIILGKGAATMNNLESGLEQVVSQLPSGDKTKKIKEYCSSSENAKEE